MKKVAILQSNYIPWKGYFDMIAAVDEFILYDDVQFTKNDWRNRNQIKTPQGVQWLTVPVGQGIDRRIRDVTVDARWQAKHWKSLASNYRRARYFGEIAAWLEPMYGSSTYSHLSQLNRCFIEAINRYLGIRTVISNSWDYRLLEGKSERLADLCTQAGAGEYVSGPAAREYLDEKVFRDRGIRLTWFDYHGYPEYRQLWGAFTPGVSIVDLLMNCGPDAHRYMKYVSA
ncbi:WbqC family protein [Candidatus Accumulibacter sp. ACC003]|uniref:WbqC family protein n=1 Tax=Candidatus Accumulibacter sp. ACC003 TaxID=2823334 RepID=UPI0025BD0FFC|nr:WbqC family protein [Candidatus Accumulibacter sp. ACC003]